MERLGEAGVPYPSFQVGYTPKIMSSITNSAWAVSGSKATLFSLNYFVMRLDQTPTGALAGRGLSAEVELDRSSDAECNACQTEADRNHRQGDAAPPTKPDQPEGPKEYCNPGQEPSNTGEKKYQVDEWDAGGGTRRRQLADG